MTQPIDTTNGHEKNVSVLATPTAPLALAAGRSLPLGWRSPSLFMENRS